MFYTVGVRDGLWTLEGLDWDNGESAFHWVIGGEKYNSLYSPVMIDEAGRVTYSSTYGKVRLSYRPRGITAEDMFKKTSS